eukprot:gene34153-biopygen16621
MYCPYDESNPGYPSRPQTLESRMPQLYDLYGDKTFDSLSKNSSSLKYEQMVLAPALAYLYGAVQFSRGCAADGEISWSDALGKKGKWEPAQIVEHLGLEVELWEGEFRVTDARLKKICSKATDLLCEASRERHWVLARKLAGWRREVCGETTSLWNLRITHLKLEAVFKTVLAFLRELRGKVVCFYCDHQAVVAMLAHFTRRNPDLMSRMRRL